ncbi:MAG: hypothetical protein GC166_00455 [Alphaproteobacteria bacterium]|nr:hypothetical protein [Alphaproteobacteria bacterium]
MNRLSVFWAILLAGFVAGTIDIEAASLISGAPFDRVLRFVAGGLLGPDALKGGMEIAALGMVLQWLMSFVIAAIYIMASTRFALLKRQWLAFGLLYGVGVYFVMNYVVVPLSAMGRGMPQPSLYSFSANMAAMLLFGVIVAWFGARTR